MTFDVSFFRNNDKDVRYEIMKNMIKNLKKNLKPKKNGKIQKRENIKRVKYKKRLQAVFLHASQS